MHRITISELRYLTTRPAHMIQVKTQNCIIIELLSVQFEDYWFFLWGLAPSLMQSWDKQTLTLSAQKGKSNHFHIYRSRSKII